MRPLLVDGGDGTGQSFAAFLAAAFGAGLLALLTPCVFPLIPVTLAFFTKRAAAGETGARGVVTQAAVYCVGIIASFTVLGAALAATVGAAGASRFATSPWTNLVFAILFGLFALSLLEVVELRPPAFLRRAASSPAGGALGVLGMGLTFLVSAFTCTAPFVGTVLVAAASATTGLQWLRPILGMATFATALALPFFLLALFPGLLARLPRSGSWLLTVKGSMGFVETAAALKFLSNTDLVWQWRVLTQPLLLALWMTLSAAGAAWLLGALHLGFNTPANPPTPARRISAGLFAAVALYCVWGLSGRPLNDWVSAFLPPSGYGMGTAGDASGGAGDPSAGAALPYHDRLADALTDAKAQHLPIFVDFTGYTCTNCRWMEKNVFVQPEVRTELQQFVRVQLYTDGGVGASENEAYQEKTFGDIALPLYAILSPDGTPVARSAGITRDAARFSAFLRTARSRATEAAPIPAAAVPAAAVTSSAITAAAAG
jgi:thiol:disulfide interchange protein DsbD